MEMTVKLKDGREILPVFDVGAWIALDELLPEETDTVSTLLKKMNSRGNGRIKAICQMASVLCNRAQVLEGKKAEFTPEKMSELIRLPDIPRAQVALTAAINRGYEMEHRDTAKNKVVDVVLEEIEKKEVSEKAPDANAQPSA